MAWYSKAAAPLTMSIGEPRLSAKREGDSLSRHAEHHSGALLIPGTTATLSQIVQMVAGAALQSADAARPIPWPPLCVCRWSGPRC
jgi:hypothetical protein